MRGGAGAKSLSRSGPKHCKHNQNRKGFRGNYCARRWELSLGGIILSLGVLKVLQLFFIHGKVASMKITELKKVPKNKIGKVNKNGIKLEPHEEDTANLLRLYGFNIEVIRPANIPKSKNPDFLISGAIWETKSPDGKSKNTIERKFHEASGQAGKFILDLRRINRPIKMAMKETLREFKKSRNIKHLIVVIDDEKIVDYRK